MSDIKWIKIASYMFEDEKIRLIDLMPEGIMVIYVWIRLLVQAGKINDGGCVYLDKDIPYTAEILARLFGKPLEAIKSALKILCDFNMIKIDSNNIIKILNWDKHQNIEGMERVRAQNRKRAADHREKKKLVEVTKENSEQNTDNNSSINEDEACDSNLELINTDSNVTVTEQNKKETKKKKENKKKDIDKENVSNSCDVEDKNLICEEDNKSLTCDENNELVLKEKSQSSFLEQHNNTKSEAAEEEDINLKALELMNYHEKITGKVGGCDYVALRSAIEIHGEKLVKMAMEVGFEKNCPDIKYAIGVLKNWRRDGYPEDLKEVKKNEFRSNGKGSSADKSEFAGFKPKEPRKLTEEERRKIESNLI